MTTIQALRRRLIQAAAGPLWFPAIEVKPAGQYLSCGEMLLFAKKISRRCGRSLSLKHGFRLISPRNAGNAKRQVFGVQQVCHAIEVRRRKIKFVHPKSTAARFSAGKKFLKSSRTMLVLWPLSLGSDVDLIHRHSRRQRVPKHRRTRSFAAGGEVFRRHETSARRRIRDVNCSQDPAPGRQQYGRRRQCP